MNVKVLTAVILLKNGHYGQPDGSLVVGDDGRNRHVGALVEDDDHRLLGGGEFAHHRDHAYRRRGSVDMSATIAVWPLNSVTLGAWSTLVRVSPWAALMKK